MNWLRDNAGISEKDFDAVFKYEPSDTSAIQLASSKTVWEH